MNWYLRIGTSTGTLVADWVYQAPAAAPEFPDEYNLHGHRYQYLKIETAIRIVASFVSYSVRDR